EMLEDCAEVFGGERQATVAREITKLHESTYRGSLSDLLARTAVDADLGRGEIVLVLAGAPQQEPAALEGGLDRVLKILLAELPLKQAARLAAQITETRDNEAYKRALQLKQ
ncbi:MAG TPA: 16S rRNA (cytidine(1402)-2'-O)-methyltransferase, partial [Steroidobacteraceae bacterium]|nr:16S rRNA (cytidine(1402)-2'-O)-methyltransferase [Steroidobacteraceae bacterium]